MDNQLDSLLKIDRCTNTARIDILGSLTPASRPDLLREIHRVRGMGITSSITVDLSRAAFVESCALAGLRCRNRHGRLLPRTPRGSARCPATPPRSSWRRATLSLNYWTIPPAAAGKNCWHATKPSERN